MSDIFGQLITTLLLLPIFLVFYGVKKSAESDVRKRRGITGVGARTKKKQLTKMGRAQATAERVPNSKWPSTDGLLIPGLLYLVSSPKLQAAKVGITRTTSNSDRVDEHLKRGWKLETFWSFQKFNDAEAIEGAAIAWLRNDLKLAVACSPKQMPQGGYTETVSLSEISLDQIKEKISEFAKLCDGGVVTTSSIDCVLVGAYMRVLGRIDATMGISGPGDRNRRKVTWQRVLVSDNSGQLVVELSGPRRIRDYPALIGTPIELIGRVESLGKELRMTNPSWKLHKRQT